MKRILICVVGGSPSIVTESLYALGQKHWFPDEVHLIATTFAAQKVKVPLVEPGEHNQIQNLFRHYEWSRPPVAVHLHLIRNPKNETMDIRNSEDGLAAADTITRLVRKLSSDEHSELHFSVAGGRKTQGIFLFYAAEHFARTQDKLSHVLVDQVAEFCPNFYFPTRKSHRLTSGFGLEKTEFDAKDITVDLIEMEFTRLRDWLPPSWLTLDLGYADFVKLVNTPQKMKLELVEERGNRGRDDVKVSGWVSIDGLARYQPEAKAFAALWYLTRVGKVSASQLVEPSMLRRHYFEVLYCLYWGKPTKLESLSREMNSYLQKVRAGNQLEVNKQIKTTHKEIVTVFSTYKKKYSHFLKFDLISRWYLPQTDSGTTKTWHMHQMPTELIEYDGEHLLDSQT